MLNSDIVNFIKDMRKAGRNDDEIIVYVVAKYHLNYNKKLEEEIKNVK